MQPVEGISEPAFLLTELRYTLGQLHVQVADLEPEQRSNEPPGYRCIDAVLKDLLDSEVEYQKRYSQILHIPQATAEGEDQHVPLPVTEGEEQEGTENSFEHRRAHTITILEQAGATWSDELLDAVKQQVAADRHFSTEIAECRKTIMEQPTRPDLAQPLQGQTS